MTVTCINRGEAGILAVPVLDDNLVYLVYRSGQAVLIDAGEASPVRGALTEHQLTLRHIFITHTHGDHIFGEGELQREVQSGNPAAVGPVETMDAPGHTSTGKMFYVPDIGALFTGDTLISGACGRASNMDALFYSLQKIKKLPPDTLILGGHNYLEDNLLFGLEQEPDNLDIQWRLEQYRISPASALHVPLEEELKTNVLLRAPDLETFTALRCAKDRFG